MYFMKKYQKEIVKRNIFFKKKNAVNQRRNQKKNKKHKHWETYLSINKDKQKKP